MRYVNKLVSDFYETNETLCGAYFVLLYCQGMCIEEFSYENIRSYGQQIAAHSSWYFCESKTKSSAVFLQFDSTFQPLKRIICTPSLCVKVCKRYLIDCHLAFSHVLQYKLIITIG